MIDDATIPCLVHPAGLRRMPAFDLLLLRGFTGPRDRAALDARRA